ncbi:MAG: hypothetical protein Q9166_006446 [cf. Caloplaca sp. 2 TL-2023]
MVSKSNPNIIPTHTHPLRATYTVSEIHAYLHCLTPPLPSHPVPYDFKVSLTNLRSLQQHHLTTYPFENLSLHYSLTHTISLDVDALYEKFVGAGRGRGGYCMENNALFGTVLRTLGYEVTSVGARICDSVTGGEGLSYGGWSHMVNIITIAETKYMVDVGFGGNGATGPLILEEGRVHERVAPSEMRLVLSSIPEHTDSGQRLWLYQTRSTPSDEWQAQYCFTETEYLPQDYEIMNYWTSTSRKSIFTQSILMAKMLMDEKTGKITGNVTMFDAEAKQKMGNEVVKSRTCKSEKERVEVLREWFGLHRKYGKVVRIGPNEIDIADGAALGPIYVDKGGFLKTSNYHKFYVDGFPSIFSSSDPAYRAPRAKAVAPLFSIAAIRRDSDRISECVGRFVRHLQKLKDNSNGAPIDLQAPARVLGFNVMSAYLFRHEYPDMREEVKEKSLLPWLNAFVDTSQLFCFPNRLFEPLIMKMERWRPQKDLEAKSAKAVHDYALNLPFDSSDKGDSFPGKLYQHGIPREQIVSECKDVMFAGLHSFGALLATTFWYLAKDTNVYNRLREEIIEHRGIDIDIQQLPYLSGVVKEGMRLAPVTNGLPRVVPSSGWEFDGHHLPAGTVVAIAAPQLFFNPDVFPDPMVFRPERWEQPSAEMQRDLVPFSVGIRKCIAKNLATVELFMAVKQVVDSDLLRGARPAKEKIEVYEWFNTAIKGNRIDIVWSEK